MHGTADRVIPSWHGPALVDAANEPKIFWKVDGADHLDVGSRPGYDDTLGKLAALVAPASG